MKHIHITSSLLILYFAKHRAWELSGITGTGFIRPSGHQGSQGQGDKGVDDAIIKSV